MDIKQVIRTKAKKGQRIRTISIIYGIDLDNIMNEAKGIYWDLKHIKSMEYIQFASMERPHKVVQFNKDEMLNCDMLYKLDEIVIKLNKVL